MSTLYTPIYGSMGSLAGGYGDPGGDWLSRIIKFAGVIYAIGFGVTLVFLAVWLYAFVSIMGIINAALGGRA